MVNPKIQRLREKTHTTVTVKDENLGEIEWIIRSIPAYDLLQNYSLFQSLPKEVNIQVNEGKVNDQDAELIEKKLLPMMEVIIPACSVDPPVTVDLKDPRLTSGDAIHMRDISFGAVTQLFAKILDISGLSQTADEERKKLDGANLPKQ